MKRRNFIKNTSGMIAATSLIGTAGQWANANDRLRVAIIGMGGRGNQHVQEVLELENVEIAAVSDPDLNRTEKAAANHKELSGKETKGVQDLRKVLDDDSIDAVIIANCNHWHALTGIWACQAGKHVYVEKPVSHNVFEGRKLVEASRKYNRMVQGGTQRRSYGLHRKAIELLRAGEIGDVFMARALHYGARESIGFEEPSTPPDWLNWDLWLGPAPDQPYHPNLVHYNWHWFWDVGSGELGNNGIHCLDIALWGLNKQLPNKVVSYGGRYGYKDQAQTPNTQVCEYEYDDGTIVSCEIRGLYTNDESGMTHGVRFYGSKGYMTVQDGRLEVYKGRNKEPEPAVDIPKTNSHQQNFFDAIRENNRDLLAAEIEDLHYSTAMCHLGNISYRLGRELNFDPKTEKFVDDSEADAMLTRDYRKPYVVPETV